MTFTFSSAPLSTLNSANTFYIQMVTAAPLINLTTAVDISATSTNTIYVLTGGAYTGGVLSFPNQTMPTKTYSATHVGYVLIRMDGANPAPTDPLICYVPHANSFGSQISLPAGTYAIPVSFQVGGLLVVVDGYQYSASNYASNGAAFFNNGIIQLIGTENNTLSYTNPHNRTPINVESFNGAPAFNRDNSSQIGPFAPVNMLRFRGNGDIKFNSDGQLGFFGGGFSTTIPYKLWGSNTLSQGWTYSTMVDANNWTELVELPYAGNTGLYLTSTFSTSEYYKYLRISTDTGLHPNGFASIGNIDMWGCTVRTPFVDFA